MDLRNGFTLESPDVIVPWTTTEPELRRLLGPAGLREVTSGYYVVTCHFLGGVRHRLGFHFAAAGALEWLEVLRDGATETGASFEEFQRHLECAFGPPHRTTAGAAGFPSHEWRVPGARIQHSVVERFGREEHLHIRRERITPG
jgi:hypothetical protein